MVRRRARAEGASSWNGRRVSTRSSIRAPRPPSGAVLSDAYAEAVRSLTFGVLRLRDNAVVLGPWTLLRFAEPAVTDDSVDWPIEGGLLAGEPGGHWIVRTTGGAIEAILTGYAPRLPRLVYSLTQLQVHEQFARLFLLRLRGREPAPGPRATPKARIGAATVDLALCLTIAGFAGRRHLGRTLAFAAAYHVACWSVSGRTLGGLLMRQRVVAVDGSRLTPPQALLRFALLPASWIARRPLHDEISSSDVISD